LKFFASQRLDIRRIQTLKGEGGEAVGNRVRVKVVKNKVAAPFRQAEFDIEYGKGIATTSCLLDLGVRYGVLGKSGAHYSYGQRRIGHGREQARAFLTEHPEIAVEIEQGIYTATGIATERSAERTDPGESERDRDATLDRDDTQTQPASGEPLAVAS
jgi:recombination protein RecA